MAYLCLRVMYFGLKRIIGAFCAHKMHLDVHISGKYAKMELLPFMKYVELYNSMGGKLECQ